MSHPYLYIITKNWSVGFNVAMLRLSHINSHVITIFFSEFVLQFRNSFSFTIIISNPMSFTVTILDGNHFCISRLQFQIATLFVLGLQSQVATLQLPNAKVWLSNSFISSSPHAILILEIYLSIYNIKHHSLLYQLRLHLKHLKTSDLSLVV